MPLIHSIAFCMFSLLTEAMSTTPSVRLVPGIGSSSMLIVVPVSFWIFWIVSPPFPMIAPINSAATLSCSIRGTKGL